MATYLNGYTLLERVRIQLGEFSTAYVNGTDSTGKYKNFQIMDGINAAQRFIYNTLFTRIPYTFEEEIALTGVSSVYTLPADFGQLRYFKDADGYQIFPISTDQRRTTNSSGSDRRYYRKGNTPVVDKASSTDVCTLIYYRKCRDIHQGKASAGAATSITFSTDAKLIVDYYNGLTIENITKGWVDVIDDYAVTRVATISETAAANDYYGTVSDLPESFHFLMVPRAVFEITGGFPGTKDSKISGIEFFQRDLMATLRAYAGAPLDTYPEQLWCSYASGYGGPGARIPGH